MKLMTCIFRLLLVSYIFVSSVILLKSYNNGNVTMATHARKLTNLALSLTDCPCVQNAMDFLQKNF